MSGPCLCSWCVEARLKARAAETAALRGLAAYDQARGAEPMRLTAEMARDLVARRLRAMREARERAGASCP